MDKDTTLSMLSCSVDNNLNINASSLTFGDTNLSGDFTAGGQTTDLLYRTGTSDNLSCWHWWQDYYYPSVITNYYPVYIRERALDKGKQAYEIIKMLKDKGLVEIDTVKKFMSLMDALINML